MDSKTLLVIFLFLAFGWAGGCFQDVSVSPSGVVSSVSSFGNVAPERSQANKQACYDQARSQLGSAWSEMSPAGRASTGWAIIQECEVQQ